VTDPNARDYLDWGQRAPTILRYNADGTVDILCRPCGQVVVENFDGGEEHRAIAKAHKARHRPA
jgi:hypothetical protein